MYITYNYKVTINKHILSKKKNTQLIFFGNEKMLNKITDKEAPLI